MFCLVWHFNSKFWGRAGEVCDKLISRQGDVPHTQCVLGSLGMKEGNEMGAGAEVRAEEAFTLHFLKVVCILGVLCLCQLKMRKQAHHLRLKLAPFHGLCVRVNK